MRYVSTSTSAPRPWGFSGRLAVPAYNRKFRALGPGESFRAGAEQDDGRLPHEVQR